MQSKKHIVAIFVLVGVIFLVGSSSKDVRAVDLPPLSCGVYGTGDALTGWGWSDGIGWISTNCEDAGVCGTSEYAVSVDAAGLMTGCAWSNHIGWITFENDALAECPSGVCEARLNRLTHRMSGWARALNGTDVEDGFSGWISLAGTATDGSPYAVVVDDPTAESWAWGDTTLGWILFDTLGLDLPPIEVSCSISASRSARGDDVTWTAIANGGAGGFTYLWHGSTPLEGHTENPTTVTYSTIGTKVGHVTVTDSDGNSVDSEPCLDPDDDPDIDIVFELVTGVVGNGTDPIGSGEVRDTPNDILCTGAQCVDHIDPDTTLSLAFIRASGSIFIQWVDASGGASPVCSGGAGNTPCAFTMNDDATVKAQTRKTECSNGVNDDGAQGVDLADPDCTDSDDDSEGGPAVCGDTIVSAGEECDDGNTTNGDGCSSQCTLEDVTECNDGLDNDNNQQADHAGVDLNGDGDFDDDGEFPPDPGCRTPADDDEILFDPTFEEF